VCRAGRISILNPLLYQCLQFFLDNFKPEKVILVLSQCDLLELTENFDGELEAENWINAFNLNLTTKVKIEDTIFFGIH